MIGYLQTFLPFISGISEDLYNKRCIRQIKVADDGIYIIKINEEIIEYSKGIKSEFEKYLESHLEIKEGLKNGRAPVPKKA